MGKGPETEQANWKLTGRHTVIGFVSSLVSLHLQDQRGAGEHLQTQDLVNSGRKEL